MKSSSKIIVAIVAAGTMAMGAAAVAASGAGDCGDGQWGARDGHPHVRFDPVARADQRLARFKAELKITPAQEPLWQAFADRTKSEAGKGIQAMREQAKDENLTAPERMTRMTEIMKQRLAAMESVGDAFNRLYQGLTPEQRKIADERATRMARMYRGAHHGPAKHRGPPPADSEKG
jgi:periplasmic protein CpxP/Spy